MRGYIETIERMGACRDAIEWLVDMDYPTLQDAWDNCLRADWMLWLISVTDLPKISKINIAKCALEIAELLEDISPEARRCNETTRRYLAKEVPKKELEEAKTRALSDLTTTLGALSLEAAVWAAKTAAMVRGRKYPPIALAGYAMMAAEVMLHASPARQKKAADIVRKYLKRPKLGCEQLDTEENKGK